MIVKVIFVIPINDRQLIRGCRVVTYLHDTTVQDETPASKRKKNLQPSLSTGSLTKKQRREDAKHGAAAGTEWYL